MIKTEQDPLLMFSMLMKPLSPFSTLQNLKKNTNYLNARIFGINIIKYLASKNELEEKIYHSSIYLLDRLYFDLNYSFDIQKTAIACVIIMTKFLDNGVKGKYLEREVSLNIKNFDYPFIEKKILQLIDYNLNFITNFDICNFILDNGIIFTGESPRNIDKIYLSCLFQLNAVVEKKKFLNYNPIEIVFSIISFTRELYGLEPKYDIFEKIYKIPLSSYEKCLNKLKSKIHVKKCKVCIKNKN